MNAASKQSTACGIGLAAESLGAGSAPMYYFVCVWCYRQQCKIQFLPRFKPQQQQLGLSARQVVFFKFDSVRFFRAPPRARGLIKLFHIHLMHDARPARPESVPFMMCAAQILPAPTTPPDDYCYFSPRRRRRSPEKRSSWTLGTSP